MTTVSLLGALAADPSATSTASGRETGETGTPFDEIIGQVRELASEADVESRDGSASSGEGDLMRAPAQADARDLAAAAVLLGVVEEPPAALDAGAEPRDADDADSADATEADGTAAAGLMLTPVGSDVAASTTVRDAAVGSQSAESRSSASVLASSMSAPVTIGSPIAVGSSEASAESAASAASAASVAPAGSNGSAGSAGSAGPQAPSPDPQRVAAHSTGERSTDADSGAPPLARTPDPSAGVAAGVVRTGESPAPLPARTLSSLPAPMGSYADMTASAEGADGGVAAESGLTAGDRAVSLQAATASSSGSGASAGTAAGLSAIAQTAVVPAAPAVSVGDVAPDGARTVAAQVAPVVLTIAQRPAGAHQLTMTVNPDSLGPVTVRAHIGQAGEVQVELIGGTDAGRDALKSIVADLRRDLAAVSPHATLSVSTGVAADPGSGRGGQPGSEAAAGDQGARRDDAPEQGARRPGTDRSDDLAHIIRITTSTRAGVGEGLDTFA